MVEDSRSTRMSYVDTITKQMQTAIDCSCGQDKAVFFCDDKDCKNNATQQIFCMFCL